MGKFLGLDYGIKRIGIAHSDDNKIIANSLITIKKKFFFDFLLDFNLKNSIEKIIVGLPKNLLGDFNKIEYEILLFLKEISYKFPSIGIDRIDERFTSKIAITSLHLNNISKKKRSNKNLIDKISATLILQSYLDKMNFNKFSERL